MAATDLVRTQYAQVRGDRQARDVAARVAALIDEAVPRIASLVGTSNLAPIPATVYLDRGAFISATGISARTAVVGLATFPPGVIQIDGTGLLGDVEHVVPHEVAHVLIGRAMGPNFGALPTWVNEGIAEYAAGEQASQVDPISLEAVGRGESIPLVDLDRAFEGDNATRSLAYAEATSVINFLVARDGKGVIAALLATIRNQGDIGAAMRQTTGWSEADLEAAWLRSVSRRWRWPLLFQSQALVFGVMLVLFIAGYIRYRRERRRREERSDPD